MARDLRKHWQLDPDFAFLNHGSFGACPTAVLAHQAATRERMERNPVRFFSRDGQALLDSARGELAAFLGADPENLAFVPNATFGINSVLRSLRPKEGDGLLVTDHAYNACRNALNYVAEEHGCSIEVATLPYPLEDPAQIVECIAGSVSSNTRLALIDHVTSATGLVLPLAEMCQVLRDREIRVLVDGAHAPGMLPLDLETVGADYYTGNCHKWLCSPKGAGFLWVRRELHDEVRPAIISHGANAPTHQRSRFRQEFDWIGTGDPSAYLSVPESLRFMGSLLPGGWDSVMAENHELALSARDILADALGVANPAPAEMLGSLVSLPVPERTGGASGSGTTLDRDPLQEALFHRHRIEAVVASGPGPTGRLLRVSAQLYNRVEEYERLAAALRQELDLGGSC